MTVTKKVSIHGRDAFLSRDDILFGRRGLGSGGEGEAAVYHPGPRTVAIWEDFHKPAVLDGLGGADTGKAAASATATSLTFYDTGFAGQHFITKTAAVQHTFSYPTSLNGVFRIAAGEPGTSTVAGSVAQFNQAVAVWKATQGENGQDSRIRFGCRLRRNVFIKSPTTGSGYSGLFVGFTDNVGSEMPIHDTGGNVGTIKATAGDAVGICWNSNGDTGFVAAASDGGTIQSTPICTTTPTANTWYTLEVEVRRGLNDTGGTAFFYINGGAGINGDSGSATISKPCNVSTALTPIVAIYDTGGAGTLDVDWVAVSGDRDTGT